MPDSYVNSPAVNRERYMSTFRGCGSLARASALKEAGGYDESLFIYGNERDLTCRLLNLGYRVLQYPEVVTHHKNPFGVRMGQRSLYYHARNAWITQLKYAPLEDLYRMPFLVVSKCCCASDRRRSAATSPTRRARSASASRCARLRAPRGYSSRRPSACSPRCHTA
jgi:GT2 family glycosyltransferase